MPRHVMMTLDLERGVSEESRQKFYAKLKELHWGKLPDVTTAWKCSWSNSQTDEYATRIVREDLESARAVAGSPKYHAVAMIGDAPPVAFVG